MRSISKDHPPTNSSPSNDTPKDLRNDAQLILKIENSIDTKVEGLLTHWVFVKDMMEHLKFPYSIKGNIPHNYDVCNNFNNTKENG